MQSLAQHLELIVIWLEPRVGFPPDCWTAEMEDRRETMPLDPQNMEHLWHPDLQVENLLSISTVASFKSSSKAWYIRNELCFQTKNVTAERGKATFIVSVNDTPNWPSLNALSLRDVNYRSG